jgi:CubicO group peptidase (beta-lactamase class C family)
MLPQYDSSWIFVRIRPVSGISRLAPRRDMRAVLQQLTLVLAFASSFGSSIKDASAQTPDAPKSIIEQRIRHVTDRLLVETALDGIFESGTLQDRMACYHTSGVSIAVVNDFTIEWARGFGVQEADGHRRITAATRFQAGSVSKPTFAVAVMRLVERGELSLDEDVNDYLTSWKVPAVGDWHPRITLRVANRRAILCQTLAIRGRDREQC